LLFECREWRLLRTKLYKDLNQAGVIRRLAGEDDPEGRILNEPKATRAVLQFLANTQVALPLGYLQQAAERTRRDDEWILEALEEAEQPRMDNNRGSLGPRPMAWTTPITIMKIEESPQSSKALRR
jgi:hypothetical protein